MIINLDNLTFDTADTATGTWRSQYMREPREHNNQIEYRLRFKWIDPHDPENKATPERRLTLLIHDSETILEGFEEVLLSTLRGWIDHDETDVVFDYQERGLRLRERS